MMDVQRLAAAAAASVPTRAIVAVLNTSAVYERAQLLAERDPDAFRQSDIAAEPTATGVRLRLTGVFRAQGLRAAPAEVAISINCAADGTFQGFHRTSCSCTQGSSGKCRHVGAYIFLFLANPASCVSRCLPDEAAAAPSQDHKPASLSQQPVASSSTNLPDGPDHGAAETSSQGSGNAGPAPNSCAEALAASVAPAKRVLPMWMTGQAAKSKRGRSKAAATEFALAAAATDTAAVPDTVAGGTEVDRLAPKRRQAGPPKRAKAAATAAATSETAEDSEEEAAVVAPTSRRARLGKLQATVPLSDDESGDVQMQRVQPTRRAAPVALHDAVTVAVEASSQPEPHVGSMSAEQMLDLLLDTGAEVPGAPTAHGQNVPQTSATSTSGAAALRSVVRLAVNSPVAVPAPPSAELPPLATADDAGRSYPLLYADHVPWLPPPPLSEMLPPVRVVSLREKLAALFSPDL